MSGTLVWKPGQPLLALLTMCVFPTDHREVPVCLRCRSAFIWPPIHRVCPGPYSPEEKERIVAAAQALPVREPA